jgi:hypothetical protein
MAADIPAGSLYATLADSLWVDQRGLDVIRATGEEALKGSMKVNIAATFDRVWLDGGQRAVVEKDGRRWAIVAGVPTHAEIGPDGKSKWMATEPWTSYGKPDREHGVRIGTATFDAGRLIKANDHAPAPNTPWKRLLGGQLREELLQPVSPARKGVQE